MPDNKPEKSLWRQVFEASTVGIHLVLSTIVGAAIGYGLDYLLHTSPYLTVVFFIIGVISGFREVFRIARKVEKIEDGTDGKENR